MIKLWRCPICDSGIRAPERMRRNNALRYCFPCSAKAGVLVERVCPSKEQERAKDAAAKKLRETKEKEKQAAKRAAYAISEKGQLEAVIRKWLRLDAFQHGAIWGRHGRPVVSYTVRLSRAREIDGHAMLRPRETTGHAYGRDRLTITAGSDRADALTTILHEIAHLSAGYFEGAHAAPWRAVFAEAVQEVTGERPDGANRITLHDAATECVRRWLARGGAP